MGTTLSALIRWLRPQPTVERRQSPRASFTEAITVRRVDGSTFRGVGRDLSESGLGALVYADLEIGESVIVYYTRHETTASQFVCRPACVRRKHGNRYGFEFQHALSA